MHPRDWFAVGVRLLAVWIVFDGFTFLVGAFAESLTDLSRSEISRQLEPKTQLPIDYAAYAAGALVFGAALFCGAERLTRWAFDEPSPESDDSNSN